MVKNIQGSQTVWYNLAIARILLGFVFLWAFFDKWLGLGISTASEKAWIVGGSPTSGFLGGVDGTFASFFNGLAGSAFADWLFMAGLLGLGLALVFGIGLRIASVGGVILMVLMWAASLPLSTNPFVDEHIIYAAVMVTVAAGLPWQKWSFAQRWAALPFVKKNPWLR